MPRTTAELIEGILEVDETIGSLDPFIAVANELVTEVCAAAEVTPAYSESRLTLIETWLGAHFYCQRDPRFASEKAGPVSANYQYKLGLNLANTHYGQMAMSLDTFGGLAQLSKNVEEGKKKFTAGITFIGGSCGCSE